MKKSRFTEEQIIRVLKEAEGSTVKEVCRRHGISPSTFANWRAKFHDMDVSDARKLKALEDENRRLKSLWPIKHSISKSSRSLIQKSGESGREA